MESIGIQVTEANFISKKIRVPQNITSISVNPVIVITSKTAVNAWFEISKALSKEVLKFPVYCLSMATQATAREHGLNIVGTAPDGNTLADLILKDRSITSVTFICGNLRRGDLPNKLKSNGVQVLEVEAYRTEPAPVKIPQPYHGVLFFSPSAIDSFLVFNPIKAVAAFCLGNTTANHARDVGFSEIHIAESHTPESLIQTVIDFYFNLPVHAQK
jgi:uroporphyrinogen-III synthase